MSSFRLVRQQLSASRRLATRFAARRYHDGMRDAEGYLDPSRLPPVRLLRPALACLGTTAAIYLGCAAYEVRQDAAKASAARSGAWPPRASSSSANAPVTYAELQALKTAARARDAYPGGSSHRPPWLAGLHEPVVAAIGLNVATYLASVASPRAAHFFSHVPFDPRNYTLLTSTFGHFTPLHLAVNMYVVLQFAPIVMQTPQFENSNSHAVAFYLGAGTVATMGEQVAARLGHPLRQFSSSRGASGAVFALISALAVCEPDSKFGILFVPGVSFTAQQFLAGLTAFEVVGLVWGIPFLPFMGHAAHLAGIATGMAYVYMDGKKRLWQPTRRFAFDQMRRLGLV